MTLHSGVGTVAAYVHTGRFTQVSKLSQSFVQGDDVTSAPTVGAVSAYSDQVSTCIRRYSVDLLAGTITTSGAMTVTGGGSWYCGNWTIRQRVDRQTNFCDIMKR